MDDNASFCQYCGASLTGGSTLTDTSSQTNFSFNTDGDTPLSGDNTITVPNEITFENTDNRGTQEYSAGHDQGCNPGTGNPTSNGVESNYPNQGGYQYGPTGYSSNPYPGANNQQNSSQGEGFAIASLVIGIGQMLCFCIPYLNLVPAIIGLVLGILGMKSNKRGLAIAGVVLCCVFLILSLFYTIWFTLYPSIW